MKLKTIQFFFHSAGALLPFTAVAKLVSSFGGVRVLQTADPILALPFRYVFLGVGGIELVVAAICFLSKRVVLRAGLVAWLATSFLIYRLGLLWVGYHKPCGCLGNLTDALHISPKAADIAMKLILGYLMLGSYATLFSLWRQKQRSIFTPSTSSASIA